VPLQPLEDRGTTPDVPLPPGQANAVLPLQSTDPGFNATVVVPPTDGEAVPGAPVETTTAEPQTAPRPRRAVRRQVPAGEQVLRALQQNF